jgi:hypothetical protein
MVRTPRKLAYPLVERNQLFDGCGKNDDCYACRVATRGRELNATRETCLAQRTRFDPWTHAVFNHDWTLENPGLCDGCNQSDPQRLRINAGKLSLCAHCLSEFHPFWPTGSPRVRWQDLVAHLEKCMLHSSVPITARTAYLRVEPSR